MRSRARAPASQRVSAKPRSPHLAKHPGPVTTQGGARRTSSCPAAPGETTLALAEAADEGVTKQGQRPEALLQRGDEHINRDWDLEWCEEIPMTEERASLERQIVVLRQSIAAGATALQVQGFGAKDRTWVTKQLGLRQLSSHCQCNQERRFARTAVGGGGVTGGTVAAPPAPGTTQGGGSEGALSLWARPAISFKNCLRSWTGIRCASV